MTRTFVVAVLCLGALLAAGCTSASLPQPSPSLTQLASSAPTTSSTEVQHVSAGPVGVDVPAASHLRPGLANPSGNVTFAWVSPVELPSECLDTAQGGVCQPWPVMKLLPGGIVVAVRQNGMPGSRPPAGGRTTSVGGLPARRFDAAADDACQAIGGTESIAVVLPAVPGTTGWIALDACLAGPDARAANDAFAAIVASITFAR